jgi:hypothetical protein
MRGLAGEYAQAAQAAQAATLEARLEDLAAASIAQKAEAERLRVALRRATDALTLYGHHADGCAFHEVWIDSEMLLCQPACTCGLTAALETADAEARPVCLCGGSPGDHAHGCPAKGWAP